MEFCARLRITCLNNFSSSSTRAPSSGAASERLSAMPPLCSSGKRKSAQLFTSESGAASASSVRTGRTASKKSTMILFKRSISSFTTSRYLSACENESRSVRPPSSAPCAFCKIFWLSCMCMLMLPSGFFISCATLAARFVSPAMDSMRCKSSSCVIFSVMSSILMILPIIFLPCTSGIASSAMWRVPCSP